MHSDYLEIIYQDPWLVAVNKPHGLFVHRTGLDRREKVVLLQMVRDIIGQRVYPVHRLDRPTSGALLFALSPHMARRMADLVKAGGFEKHYLAVVRGYLDMGGVIEKPVRKKRAERKRSAIKGKHEKISALTHYRLRATIELPYRTDRYPSSRYSLAELVPITGRRHQLRQHMKQISHPIIGDTTYCRQNHNDLFRQRFNVHRLLLAAYEQRFIHPITKEHTSIVAALDAQFTHVIRAFGWESFLPNVLKPFCNPQD